MQGRTPEHQKQKGEVTMAKAKVAQMPKAGKGNFSNIGVGDKKGVKKFNTGALYKKMFKK